MSNPANAHARAAKRADVARRLDIRRSAELPAQVAVAKITVARHADRGLTLWEQGYAEMAFGWLAGGWAARAEAVDIAA